MESSDGNKKTGMAVLEKFMRNQQVSLKSMFLRNRFKSKDDDVLNSPKPIPELSLLANSVVARCSKILKVSTEELQIRFDADLPDIAKQPLIYARNFLEFCSYQTLHLMSKSPDYLSDKEFCRFTFDMMLAWEAPSVQSEPIDKVRQEATSTSYSNQEVEDEDGWSLFYSNSTNMAMQVDDKQTIGLEAFARIAPVCVVVADVITVHNLFDALTNSSGYRLHFLIYDKYIRSLDRVLKAARNASGPSISTLQLGEGEIILDSDGTVPTQPVLQHIGISAWPGRLTLTNCALYFESGVGLYDKATRYDLEMDIKQVIRPELTGPLGARLFDKAVMYKSTSVAEPVYFEFPEFKGNSRRDYWLEVCLEVLRLQGFIRKYNLREDQQLEILARASLGIFRYRAIREGFNVLSSNYKTLLAFNLAESLPKGDKILETLYARLALLNGGASQREVIGSPYSKKNTALPPISLLTLCQFGIVLQRDIKMDDETILVGDICVGETNPLEQVVKQTVSDTGRAEAAQATVDQVKVEGIDTNLAVMKELMFPVTVSLSHFEHLAAWEEPHKSVVFLLLACYLILWGWIRYILPSIFAGLAVPMLWRCHYNKGKPLEAFRITAPPDRNAVEQLLALQEAVGQVETLIQSGNIALLKLRALLFAVLPQATERVAVFFIVVAAALAFMPVKHLILLVFVEVFTRQMPMRRQSTERLVRRLREWWLRIPAASVSLTKVEETKKKK